MDRGQHDGKVDTKHLDFYPQKGLKNYQTSQIGCQHSVLLNCLCRTFYSQKGKVKQSPYSTIFYRKVAGQLYFKNFTRHFTFTLLEFCNMPWKLAVRRIFGHLLEIDVRCCLKNYYRRKARCRSIFCSILLPRFIYHQLF